MTLRRLAFAIFLVSAPAMLLFSTGTAEPPSLRVGLMPAMNSVPILVADAEGLFAAEGVTVELEMFRSQFYRESALQAGQIDGTISDLINAVNAWENGLPVRVAIATEGLFSLLTGPGSGITSIAAWNDQDGVATGLVTDSIVYYLAERMLEAVGGDPTLIELVPTLQLPTRAELLIADQLEAAVLPEPLSWLAIASGAGELVTSGVLPETPGVLLFREETYTDKADALRRFFRAYNTAVRLVNDDPDAYRELLVQAGEFPPAVRDRMRIPRFAEATPPSRELVADIAAWMMEKGLLDRMPRYEEIVRSER